MHQNYLPEIDYQRWSHHANSEDNVNGSRNTSQYEEFASWNQERLLVFYWRTACTFIIPFSIFLILFYLSINFIILFYSLDFTVILALKTNILNHFTFVFPEIYKSTKNNQIKIRKSQINLKVICLFTNIEIIANKTLLFSQHFN